MQAHTFLYDLTSILGVLPSLCAVSLNPQPNGSVRVQGVSSPQAFVLDAYTREPVEGLTRCCGLDLDAASAALHAPGMSPANVQSRWQDDATVELVQDYQHYRIGLMTGAYAEERLRIPCLKFTPTYKTLAQPTTEGNALLKYWRRQITDVWCMRPDFGIDLVMQGSALLATFNSGTKESITFPLTEFATGTMSAPVNVRSDFLMQMLPLVERTKRTLIKICERGLVTVEVQTTYCSFEFHIACNVV